MDNIAVLLKTEKDYIRFMKVCAFLNLSWENDLSSLKYNFWPSWEKEKATLVVSVSDQLGYAPLEYYKSKDFKIISPLQFYHSRNLNNIEISNIDKSYHFQKE